MGQLYELSAVEVVEKLKAGKVSIQETLTAMQDRIQAVDSRTNALPTLCFDRALEHAKHVQKLPVDQRGTLCGLPVTIKDLTDVEGVLTTHGSAVFKNNIATGSNKLVSRIESNGGVVYAKSNSPEFGAGGITFNDVFGITRSPHNNARSAGGSSGGAAASLANGCAWLSHGSDMAGSLRTPASFCGVASLRPAPGTIRADSQHAPFDVLGADGPMARNIADLALFTDAMTDNRSNAMQHALQAPNKTRLDRLRVAVSQDLRITSVANDVADLFQQFIDNELGGVETVREAVPDLTGAHESFDTLRAQFYATALEPIYEENRHLIKPEVVWNVEQGIAQSSQQIRHALRTQAKIVNGAARFMRDYDVLICPAVSLSSVSAEVRYPGEPDGVPIQDYYRWLAIAYASTMTTLPIITLPVSNTAEGLPFAVQLIGKPWGEAALFQVAYELERKIGRPFGPVDPV